MPELIPKQPVTGRLVVIEQVTYYPPGEDPVSTESRFSSHPPTEEQPFKRVVAVDVAPIPLEFGWVARLSQVCLVNKRPSRSVYPSPEEQEAEDNTVVYLETNTVPRLPLIEIPMGQSARFRPMEGMKVTVRSNHPAKLGINAFPG